MVMLSQRRRSRQQGMEANESLQREREMAAMTLQHIHDGVIRIDSAGRIDYLNPMAATLLQTPPEQVIGQSVFAVFRLHFEMSQHMQDNPVNESLKFRRPVELPENTPCCARTGKACDRGQYLAAALTPAPARRCADHLSLSGQCPQKIATGSPPARSACASTKKTGACGPAQHHG